jgi:hypothetical protein
MAAAAAGATPATARKTLFTTTVTLLSSSLTHSSGNGSRSRSLSCSAASAAAPRLAPQPPDLVRWVQREGGFVHPALRVANHPEHGLGVSAAASPLGTSSSRSRVGSLYDYAAPPVPRMTCLCGSPNKSRVMSFLIQLLVRQRM